MTSPLVPESSLTFSQIAAMAKNRIIGGGNTLPWNLPEDMKFFRETTRGKILIVGRKTFESFGKPLKNRYHLVVTRNKDYAYDHPQVEIVSSLNEAKVRAEALAPQWDNEIFIAGGGEIYQQSLNMTQRIYLTIIEQDFSGDTRFPELDEDVWRKVNHSSRTGDIPFSFNTFERI